MSEPQHYEQRYEAMTRVFRDNPDAVLWLVLANKVLTVIGYIAYPLLLIVTLLNGAWHELVRFVVVPAFGFVALSVFRSLYNAPRPYELFAIDPLIKKDTIGRSFPSRHAFSMMMIACSWTVWSLPVGIVLVVFACAMALIRVLAGVHFLRDVVVGVLFAILCAIVGYGLIPW